MHTANRLEDFFAEQVYLAAFDRFVARDAPAANAVARQVKVHFA